MQTSAGLHVDSYQTADRVNLAGGMGEACLVLQSPTCRLGGSEHLDEEEEQIRRAGESEVNHGCLRGGK